MNTIFVWMSSYIQLNGASFVLTQPRLTQAT